MQQRGLVTAQVPVDLHGAEPSIAIYHTPDLLTAERILV
jgi:hypothetical protein